jgi:hypothetical protein
MSIFKKLLVYIVSGLFLCPLILDSSLDNFSTADFVESNSTWTSSANNYTGDTVWGDIDNDGDLDLVAGNWDYNYVYLNDNGTISKDHSWKSDVSRESISLDLADFDLDGDLDLAVGNRYMKDSLYLNENGRFLTTPVWNSSYEEFTASVKWGDIDNDNDLDLVCGHYAGNLSIYLNNGGKLTANPYWNSSEVYYINVISLADINNDGMVDIFVGNGKLMGGDKNIVFLNNGNGYSPLPNWMAQLPRRTTAADFADYDKDGDLDLAMGTWGHGTFVHHNVNNNLTLKPDWIAADPSPSTFDLEWADISGNGYLDLVLAVNGRNMIYNNTGGVLEDTASWYTTNSVGSTGLAVGDYDKDGDLDLAFGNSIPAGEVNRIYNNYGTVMPPSAGWTTTHTRTPHGTALNDIDSDGDLDLAVAANGNNVLYFNDGLDLYQNPNWISSDSADTRCLAWGDIDGDSDVDLVTGNYGGANAIYRNNFASLTSNPWWRSNPRGNTTSIALADFDSDYDLDLAVGNKGGPNYLYLNTGTGFSSSPSWSSNDTSQTTGVAWGDLDSDGALDLAVANSGSGVQIYYNQDNALKDKPEWTGKFVNDTRSVAWADINSDGALDLITGAYDGPTYVYFNNNGSFNTVPDWQPAVSNLKTTKIYLFDVNGNGALDLLEVNDGGVNRIFLNRNGNLLKIPSWTSETQEKSVDASMGDINKDGDFDIAVVNSDGKIEVFKNSYMIDPLLVSNPTYVKINSPPGLFSSGLYSIATPLKFNIPIKYTLYDPEDASAWISAEYSDNGGGTWHKATRNTGGGDPTTGLTATKAGKSYTFLWDSKADNVVSANVIFRITVSSIHRMEGDIQRACMSTQSGIFPVDSPRIKSPLNLRVTNPTTSSLHLFWDERIGDIIDGYEIFMNASYTDHGGPYTLTKITGVGNNTIITGLADGVTYYFKLRSYIGIDVHSIFSNIANGTTIPLDLPPRTMKYISDVIMEEDSKLFNYIDLNDYFWDEHTNSTAPGNDGLEFEISKGKNINVWLNPKELLSIEPPPNYFGQETFIVTANDSKFQSNMTLNITVESVNDRPILNLTDGFIISGIQNEWINETLTAYDPADPHDKLIFSDNTTLFDVEAESGNISFNPLPWETGTYHVNITVTDDGKPNLQDFANIIVVINATATPPISELPISVLVYPDSKSIVTTLKPTLMWDGYDPDSPEIWYDVYLAPDESLVYELNPFTRIATHTKNTSLTLTDDLTNGYNYYWTVIPFDGLVRGTCASGIWKFSIDVSQPTPVVKLINPSNHKIVNSSSVRLTWSLDYKGDDKVKYFVYFDTSPIPKTLISSDETEQYVDITDLEDGMTYYWKVIPRAGNVIGECRSGTWSFSINLNFVPVYGVSLITSYFTTIRINETILHDVTIINDGNNVDTFLVTVSSSTLAGSVSLTGEGDWFSPVTLGSAFLELEQSMPVTISLLFEVHDPSLVGIHFVELTVSSLGAQNSDLYVSKTADITVNVLDVSGNGKLVDIILDDPNSTKNNDTPTEDDRNPRIVSLNTNLNWTWLLLAVIIAIILVAIYTGYLMRKTRKKFEVYQTAQEILDSKELDGVSPTVAGFLGAGTKSATGASAVPTAELSAEESAVFKEAIAISRGRYRHAEDELMLLDRPYSAAASDIGIATSTGITGAISKKIKETVGKPIPAAYQPNYIAAGPVKPYTMAARNLPEAKPAPTTPMASGGIPMATPLATPVDTAVLPTTRPLKTKSYEPNHMYLEAEKPYAAAAKLVLLEQKLREGKIGRRLFEELKGQYV